MSFRIKVFKYREEERNTIIDSKGERGIESELGQCS